jgi:3-hydroxyisobutyrate dehydrogenase-like beta-hydroxyacid dehydrogenase
MLKDIQLCLQEARAAGAGFPFAGLAGELYSAGMGRGLADQDFAAVLEVVEGLADTRL